MSKLRGLGVAMVTPFTENLEPDFSALRKLTRHLIEGGVDFLVVLGTTGESAVLNAAEKAAVIETVMDENAGKLPVVLGCGGNDTRKVSAEIATMSAKYNPDAFLSVCPYYNKPTQEGLYRHFKAVLGATDIPVILYNVPGRTSCNLLPETALRIAAECPNAVAIKEASGSLEQGMAILRDRSEDFLVLSGDDNLTLPMIGAGYDGVISVIGNAFPKAFSELVHAALKGDFTRARELQNLLLPSMGLIFREGNPAGVKSLLAHLGICRDDVRLPLVKASERLSDELKAEMEVVGQQVQV